MRGHGGEAALLWVDFLFRLFPLRHIVTEVYEFAPQLVQMAEAMGFEERGFLPEHFWWQDRHWGVHRMVLTRANWDRCRERFAGIIDVQRIYDESVAAAGNGRRLSNA